MSIHQSDPNRRPDEEYEPGVPAHLVIGATGRLLDARRTPVTIVALCDRTGQLTVEIGAFEDAGARWTLPYEEVRRFQFQRGGAVNDAARTVEIEEIIRRLDRPMIVMCRPEQLARTNGLLADQTEQARAWMGAHSAFLGESRPMPDPEKRESDPRLLDDFGRYIAELGLTELEDAFAGTFVSAPFGELIKGHRIVLAELGLAGYQGKAVRDERLFDEPWTRARRAGHILARLAFIRALAAELGIASFVLYRGVSTEGTLCPRRQETFISMTFSRAVAESLFDARGPRSEAMLTRQLVPVERVFMTYLETAHMNRRFKEAEAIVLAEEGGATF